MYLFGGNKSAARISTARFGYGHYSAEISAPNPGPDRMVNALAGRRAFSRGGYFGLGLPPAPPAPDSPIANTFIEAHPSRWCDPGQADSGTCRALVAPRPIRRVIIHTIAVGPENDCIRFGTISDVVRGWQNAGRAASSHYLVDRDGTITQMVREANVAFHVVGNNTDSIGIEHADVCNKPDAYTTALYERSAALVRDIATRRGFAINVFGINTNDQNAATVLGHVHLRDHGDPGPYWDWEYYAQLLSWDGRTPASRPFRLVASVAQTAAAPTAWQVRSRAQVAGEARRCIPNTHCANQNHSYGDNYWRAAANTPGSDVVFQFSVTRPGLYKISLWWPNVSGANPATLVEAEIQKAGGPARANGSFDQRRNHGRWNDLGSPFTFDVPGGGGAQGTVRIRRRSPQAGTILADSIRVLKVR
jgi:hypothetical protein